MTKASPSPSSTELILSLHLNDDYILQEGAKAGMLPESIEKEKKIGRLQRENFPPCISSAQKCLRTDSGSLSPWRQCEKVWEEVDGA